MEQINVHLQEPANTKTIFEHLTCKSSQEPDQVHQYLDDIEMDTEEINTGQICIDEKNGLFINFWLFGYYRGFFPLPLDLQNKYMALLKSITMDLSLPDKKTFIAMWKFRKYAWDENVTLANLYNYFKEYNAREKMYDDRIDKIVEIANMTMVKLHDLKEEEYIGFGYYHLMKWFFGGKEMIILKDALFNPTNLALYGSLSWWMLHVASPHLEMLYKNILSTRRFPRFRSIELNHETLTRDFVQAACFNTATITKYIAREKELNLAQLLLDGNIFEFAKKTPFSHVSAAFALYPIHQHMTK